MPDLEKSPAFEHLLLISLLARVFGALGTPKGLGKLESPSGPIA